MNNNQISNPKVDVPTGKTLNDKDYLNCLLSSLKEMTKNYAIALTEASNETLYNDYQIYQGIDKAINNRDKELFLKIVHNNKSNKNISYKMKKALKTFTKFEKYILNAITYEYSNGITEGLNNLIKQVKHSACGYRKFKHLKARIMLIKGLINPIVS